VANQKHSIEELEAREQEIEAREQELEAQVRDQEQRSKRLQLIVYPSLLAFIVLAAYGFFLIANLTSDVSRLASSVHNMAITVDRDMGTIATKMVHMDQHMVQMRDQMTTMNSYVELMTNNTTQMAMATSGMQRDMWSLNQNVSTPFSMMNNAMPWGVNQGRFPGGPGPLPIMMPPPLAPAQP
jgi:hypothetical protein